MMSSEVSRCSNPRKKPLIFCAAFQVHRLYPHSHMQSNDTSAAELTENLLHC